TSPYLACARPAPAPSPAPPTPPAAAPAFAQIRNSLKRNRRQRSTPPRPQLRLGRRLARARKGTENGERGPFSLIFQSVARASSSTPLPGCGLGHRVGDVPVPRRRSTGAVTSAA